MLKNKRGISLIVLVITIIVMIILATVVIVSITNNDVVEKANEAVDKSDLKTMQEGADIALGNVLLKKYGDISSITTNDVKEQMNKNGMDQAEINKYNITYNAAEGIVIVTKKVEEVELHLTEEEATAAGWTWSGNKITGYTGGSIETLVIPCKIGEYDITTIDADGDSIFADAESPSPIFTTVIFSKGITTINEENCVLLRCDKIILPSTITNIGKHAFSECSVKNLVMENGIDEVTIGDNAFSDCTSLETVNIPDSVTSVGYDAFSDCTSLVEITIPSSLTSIENRVFKHCTNLKSIVIPDSVTSVGTYVFQRL